MEIKIQVKTPKGKAQSTLPLLKKYLIGFNLSRSDKCEAYADDANIYMDIEAPLRKCLKIQKNVCRFDAIMRMALDSKQVKKKLSVEGGEELKEMLTNHTSVIIIKKASAEEIEENGKSFWDNMKEKLKRVNPF